MNIRIRLENGELCVDGDDPDVVIHAVDLANDLYVIQKRTEREIEAIIVHWRRGHEAMQAKMTLEEAHNWQFQYRPWEIVNRLFDRAKAAGQIIPVEVREPHNPFDPKNWGV